jgi:hypothetical protein
MLNGTGPGPGAHAPPTIGPPSWRRSWAEGSARRQRPSAAMLPALTKGSAVGNSDYYCLACDFLASRNASKAR